MRPKADQQQIIFRKVHDSDLATGPPGRDAGKGISKLAASTSSTASRAYSGRVKPIIFYPRKWFYRTYRAYKGTDADL